MHKKKHCVKAFSASVSLLMSIIVAACVAPAPPDDDNTQSDTPPLVPSVTLDDLNALVTGNNAFAFDLYQAIRAEDGNLLYSPFSISQVLAMVYAGARGETAQQMAATLRFALPQERLHSVFNALDLALASRGSGEKAKAAGFELNVANALWGQEGYPFMAQYLDLLVQNYGSGVMTVDFERGAEDTINRWVSEHTEGRIQEIVSKIPPTTTLVLANAVYFNAKWDLPFDEEDTYEEPFHLLDGKVGRMPMMHQIDQFRYAEGDGYQAIELPYQDRTVAMVILLPNRDQFREIEEGLTGQWVQGVLRGLTEEEVVLTMPKFRFEAKLDPPLAALGMPSAFSAASADFSGIAERKPGLQPIFIGTVSHKAFIDVNELRTEAAAATVVEMAAGAAAPTTPKVMKIDRPFIFFIHDIDTGAILFVGRVMNPPK